MAGDRGDSSGHGNQRGGGAVRIIRYVYQYYRGGGAGVMCVAGEPWWEKETDRRECELCVKFVEQMSSPHF